MQCFHRVVAFLLRWFVTKLLLMLFVTSSHAASLTQVLAKLEPLQEVGALSLTDLQQIRPYRPELSKYPHALQMRALVVLIEAELYAGNLERIPSILAQLRSVPGISKHPDKKLYGDLVEVKLSYRNGLNKAADRAMDKVISQAKNHQLQRILFECYIEKAWNFLTFNDLQSTMKNVQLANQVRVKYLLKESTQRVDDYYYSQIKWSTAKIHEAMGDYKKAAENLEELMIIDQGVGNSYDSYIAMAFLAMQYRHLKDFDKAELLLNRVVENMLGHGFEVHYSILLSYIGLANIALDRGYMTVAESYIKRLQKNVDENSFVNIQLRYKVLLSRFYLANNKYRDALQELKSLNVQTDKTIPSELAVRALGLMAKAYAGIPDYTRAYQTGVVQRQMSNKNNNIAKIISAAVAREQYDYELTVVTNGALRKENELIAANLKSSQLEVSQAQLRLLLAVLVAFIFLVFTVFQFRHRSALKEMANIDGLTGALNRRAIFEYGNALMKENNPLVVVLLDLDHFKSINDEFGHIAGDEVLREVARRARSVASGTGHFGRIGGEEFVFVLPNIDSNRAFEICRDFAQEIKDVRYSFNAVVTASVGVAVKNSETDFSNLVEKADQAMYLAKQQGRDCVRCEDQLGVA